MIGRLEPPPVRRLHTAVFAACVVTGAAALFVETPWWFVVAPVMTPGLLLAQLSGRPGSLPFQVLVVLGNVAGYALLFWSVLVWRDRWRAARDDRRTRDF